MKRWVLIDKRRRQWVQVRGNRGHCLECMHETVMEMHMPTGMSTWLCPKCRDSRIKEGFFHEAA